jgi:hypothetical protein
MPGTVMSFASRRLSSFCFWCLQLMPTYGRCLSHVNNLGICDFMSFITKTAVIETKQAIWDYDPEDPSNRILGRDLDAVAIVRTLAVKVKFKFRDFCLLVPINWLQIQSSSQRIEHFNQLQRQYGIKTPLVIPLHGNTRWGSASGMCERGHKLRSVSQ